MEETLRALEDIFDEVTDLGGAPFERGLRLGVDFPLDSGMMLRVLTRLERRYGVRFNLPLLLALETIGDLQDALERLRKEQA